MGSMKFKTLSGRIHAQIDMKYTPNLLQKHDKMHGSYVLSSSPTFSGFHSMY
jgi:hypothetical protein